MRTIMSTLFLVLVMYGPAFAEETTVVYKSGILVSVFVGICALIVVAQLVPALMLIVGFIKASVGLTHKEETPATEPTRK